MIDEIAILVIEDEIEIQKLLVRIIHGLRYTAYTANNGDEGLRILDENGSEIKLIILDLLIPGMSGWDIFPIIRKKWPDIKILISSGYLDLGQISEIIEPGIVEILSKPYTINELRHTICRMIESKTAH